MKTPILFIAFVLFNSVVFSQSEHSGIIIKMYGNLDKHSLNSFDLISNSGKLRSETDYSTIGHLSVSLELEKDKFTHEFELSRLVYNQIDHLSYEDYGDQNSIEVLAGEEISNFQTKLRYELGFTNQSTRKIKPMIGFAAQPYFYYSKFVPAVITFFPTNTATVGTTLFLVPRLMVDISKKIFLDVNIPIGIVDFYWVRKKSLDPSLTIEEQVEHKTNHEFVYKTFQIRLGLGIRI